MNKNLFVSLEQALKKDPRFISNDEHQILLKNVIRQAAEQLDESLISLLLEDTQLREVFFKPISDAIVFDSRKFITFLNNKEFLPDSYTAFKNKVGLSNTKGDYLSDSDEVVLSFPYKDCVLAGGQDKEDTKRQEVFYNEVLGRDEIDRLLDPKTFTNFKKYKPLPNPPLKGEGIGVAEEKLSGFTRGEDGVIKDNLIIKGNNLLALHSLRKEFAGKVKLIYIDPPYNTGNDSFNYNDRFNHSTWLTFMKNRLEVARELLRDDGVIFVQCDDNEYGYLKVLMDSIFTIGSYLNTISVKTKASSGASGGGEDKKFKKNIEFILCYGLINFEGFGGIYEETELMQYIKEMKENGTSFKYTNVLYKRGERKIFKTIKDGSGNDIVIYSIDDYEILTVKAVSKLEGISEKEVYEKYYDFVMTTTNAQTSIRTRVWEATGSENNLFSIEYYPKSGKNKGKKTELLLMGKQKVLVIWLKDTAIKKDGEIFKRGKIGTFWDGFSWINVQKEGQAELKSGKKPEELLKQVLLTTTIEGDIILDYHLGSGTTAAVAHKMGRQYIGVEQMDYIETISVERMKKVIEGEQGGVSKSVEWKGGGEFVYMEMMEANQKYLDKISAAKDTKTLLALYKEIQESGFINYYVDIKTIDENISEFEALSLDNQKKFLAELLDKNLLYVNYSEIEDVNYGVSDEEKELNREFYK